jgi:DUF1365 family protein
MTASALYAGHVVHHRQRPRRHSLRYRVFWLLLDLDELGGLARRLWLFSHNRLGLLSFRDRDYAAGSQEPLRGQIERLMSEAGLEPDGGPIRLLTMPRLMGYAFNPLNVYFCHRRDGALAAILYEVNNTFGERHSYMIPVTDPEPPIYQSCAKNFHVSPFMDMDLTYRFSVRPPGDAVAVTIAVTDRHGTMLTASLSGKRQALTDLALLRAVLLFPLLTLKVSAGILWEALFIWLKGVGVRSHPHPPSHPVTFVAPEVTPRETLGRSIDVLR